MLVPAALAAGLAVVGLASCRDVRGSGSAAAGRAPGGTDKLVRLGNLLPASQPGAALPALPAPAGEVTPDNPYETKVRLTASRVGRLRLEMAGTSRLATLSWQLEQDHGFSRFRAISFPLANDGKPHAYEVDLRREAHWHGEVEALRLEVDAGAVRLGSLAAQPPNSAYRAMSLGGETLPSLAAGGTLTLQLPSDLPDGTMFEAKIGLIPEYAKDGVRGVFHAWLEDRNGRHAWLDATVAGGTEAGPAWQPVRLELPAGGGRGGDNRLVLQADAVRWGAKLPDGVAVWGAPMLIRPGRPEGRNLVVILIDTLRADHLGAYGDRLGLTPRLDALAAESVRFDQMMTPAPWTLPSVCSLLTGLYPETHGAGQRFGDFSPSSPRQNDFAPTGLPGGVRTLARILGRNDFFTFGIFQNFYILPGFGVHQGFDEYTSIEDRAEVLVDRALDRLRQVAGDRRTFLYLHLFDLHSPYSPPEPECGQVLHRLVPGYHGRTGCEGDRSPETTTLPPAADRPWFHALYRAELAYTDRQVGRFLDGLRKLGLEDSTVVAVLSDHGEEFWERLPQEGALGYETNSDHGHTLYQELVHVPALLRIPGRRPAVIREVVQTVDLFPTLLRVVGVEPPPNQGIDLTPLLDGQPQTTRPSLLADVILHGRPRWSVRRGPWKLVVARDPALPVELYDLDHDPGELDNQAARRPQLVSSLRAWGERELAARQAAKAQFLRSGDTLGATYLEWRYITKLRALGYLK